MAKARVKRPQARAERKKKKTWSQKKKKEQGTSSKRKAMRCKNGETKKKKRLHSDNLLLGTNKKAERSSYRGEQQEQS